MFCLVLRLFRLAVQELHTWEVYQGTNRGVISDWKPFVDFVICLSFCFVIYVSFYLGIFSSVSRIVFLNLLLFMHFCFILCIHLLVTSFQVCIYVWLYSWKSVFIHMFFHMFIVVFIHLLNQFMIVLGNDLFVYWCFVFVLYGIHCFMQHTILCIHLVFFTWTCI